MKGSILVVDDNRLNRVLLSAHLTDLGYQVQPVSSGQIALDLLNKQPFDVVLLDLLMPDVDGYSILAYMKNHATLQHIPVIVISAMKDMASIVNCIKLGATDYLPKPFEPVLLKARLEASLNKKFLRDAERSYTQELQAQNEELDAFAGTVAHDLLNPLAAIIGFSELLLIDSKTASEEMQRNWLASIINTGYRMQNIIDELLMLAKVRKEAVKTYPLNMDELVNEAIERLPQMIGTYQPKITRPDTWLIGMGHGPWVVEIWVNYLSNGLKYGGRPPILELGSDRPGPGLVRYWVRDNGPGIAEQDKSRLFVPFTRLNQIKIDGQGLGLSIVKRIADKLGGEVGLESEPGRGSLFWFSLDESQ